MCIRDSAQRLLITDNRIRNRKAEATLAHRSTVFKNGYQNNNSSGSGNSRAATVPTTTIITTSPPRATAGTVTTSQGSDAMDLSATRGGPRPPLTAAQKQYRKDNNLCSYCASPSHYASECPAAKARNNRPARVSVVQTSTVKELVEPENC